MEKTNPPEKTEKVSKASSSQVADQEIWDCGSSLYDSFELKSLEKQLDSAISSRTLSMSHLSDRRLPPPPPSAANKKPASKISRSFQKLVRAVFFRPRNTAKQGIDFVAYDRSAALSTIPEAPEFDGFSPELRSLARRTASERFSAATSMGISCS